MKPQFITSILVAAALGFTGCATQSHQNKTLTLKQSHHGKTNRGEQFLTFEGKNFQVDDVRIALLSYTAYEKGSRTIKIVGDSTGIKTTLHLKLSWLQNGGEIQVDEQNPYFPDHSFDYGQTYAAEARFAEQFVRLNGMTLKDPSASHD